MHTSYDHYPHWSAPVLLLPAAQQPARRFEKRGGYMICTACQLAAAYCACERQAIEEQPAQEHGADSASLEQRIRECVKQAMS
jgi:hypothetical protein